MLRLRWLIVVVFCCVWLGSTLPAHADWDPAFDCADVEDIPPEECEALQALYESTSGDDWTDNTLWGVSNHAAEWFGITVEDGHVTWVVLNNNHLEGPIPPEITQLSGLLILELSSNILRGRIPFTWEESRFPLSGLQLAHNCALWTEDPELHTFIAYVSEPLSSEDAIALYSLDEENYFNCNAVIDIPYEECEALVAFYDNTDGENWESQRFWGTSYCAGLWYGVTVINGHVTRLYIEGNNMASSLPPELGNLTQIERLYLRYNNLTGSIPEELGSLTNLHSLYLSDNRLSGELPSWMNDAHLEHLYRPGNTPDGGHYPTTVGLKLYGNCGLWSNDPEQVAFVEMYDEPTHFDFMVWNLEGEHCDEPLPTPEVILTTEAE